MTLESVDHMASRKETRDDQQFKRFLEAADNLGAHLTMVFDDAFVRIVPTVRGSVPEFSRRTRSAIHLLR